MSVRTSRSGKWGAPVNVGPPINSAADEGGAALSSDGLTLFFNSNRTAGSGDHDIWLCRRVSPGAPWDEAVNLGPHVNSGLSDWAPTLSSDGLTLTFAVSPGKRDDEDLWTCVRPSWQEAWSPRVNLGTSVNSTSYDGGPAVSADSKLLLFHSNRPGGEGSYDLWMCSRSARQMSWGTPVNLGPSVNSPFKEHLPIFSPDAQSMLFGSDRPGGYGNFDLYHVPIRLHSAQEALR